MPELAANIWADGPSVSPTQPYKPLIRQWGTWVEGVITAFVNTGGTIFFFKSTMDGILTPEINSIAWVLGDPVVENNGIYKKLGTSGTGSWQRMGDLPYSFIIANDAGAGTPNAIQATTSIPVSGSALVWLQVADTNTASPVTVSFNDGPALVVKSNSGNDIAAGGLVAGTTIMGIVSGFIFRLVSDQASSAIVAAAEAAQDAAEAARNAAQAAAASVNIRTAATRTALKGYSTTTTTYAVLTEGDREGLFRWTAGDYATRIAADTQEGIYLKANAIAANLGAWVRQGGWAMEGIYPEWFGAVGDGVADDTAALEACAAFGLNTKLGPRSYVSTRKLVIADGVQWLGSGGCPILKFGPTEGFFQDTRTKVIFKGTGTKEHVIVGATSTSFANPDVSAPYLADSGTRGNTYRNVDWTVAFSAGFITGSGSRLDNFGVFPYFDGIEGYKGVDGRLSDDWDVGVWSRNGDWAGGDSLQVYGHWRKAALLITAHDIGDGKVPSAESQRWVNCKFQGFWGVSIRSPETIVGSNWGFADTILQNCDIRSLNHQSRHLATSSFLETPFTSPSGCLDIAGGTMARINIIGGRRLGYDDIGDFFGNLTGPVRFEMAYAEAKTVKVSGATVPNSQGFRNVAGPAAGLIIYRLNDKYAADLSPKKPRDSALPGRYTVGTAGVFNPTVCLDDDSDEQRFSSYTGPRLSPGQGWRVQDALNNTLFQITNNGRASFGATAGLELASFTTAQFADKTHAVNTTGKFLYREYYNSTTGRKMRANGSAVDATWVDMMGTNTITPV
jgi:hypothetical protein